MALGINTNIASLSAQNQLNKSQSLSNEALTRLSSGLRINSAKDDAAGLAISTRLDAQARGQNVAQRNANDAISMIQTAEGALDEVVNNLQRMRELSVQAANGSNSADELTIIQEEITARSDEIARIVSATSFNNQNLLDGTAGAAGVVTFQVGANTIAGVDTLDVTFADMSANTAAAADVTVDASAAITTIDTALDAVNTQRSTFGAGQNRMESVINTLATSAENATAAKGRIVDADFASETAKLAKANVLQQAGISVLAQANARPNQVLSLLQ
jgi:flagellin